MSKTKGLLKAFWRPWDILFRLLARHAFAFLDLLVPKNKRLVVFGCSSGTAWRGNTRALYEYIVSHPCGLEAYYYLRPRQRGVRDKRCVCGLSWRAASVLLRAKTYVSSHGIGEFFPYMCSRRKLVVQTWHGIPLKTLLFTEKNLSPRDRFYGSRLTKRDDVFLAPSRLAAWLFCSCFRMDPRKIFLCGQPRNDILLAERAEPSGSRLRELLPEAEKFDKIILYCPTYRHYAKTRLFPFDDFNAGALDDFLARNRAAILLRTHINDLPDTEDFLSERVLDFSFKVCPDVNYVLPDVDVLITDYSSMYLDFILMDRPVMFVPYDLDEYEQKRGLMFDDYDYWTPGAKAYTFHEFVTVLDDAFHHPQKYAQARKTINSLLNYYQDGNSCVKIVEMIKRRVGVE